jgi:hypothetical protein
VPQEQLRAPCANLRQIDFLAPLRDQIKIEQMTVVHTPLDKLTDAFVTILAGAHGLVEVNTRLRSDLALQQAFGRTSCADQSTIQDTLNACTEPCLLPGDGSFARTGTTQLGTCSRFRSVTSFVPYGHCIRLRTDVQCAAMTAFPRRLKSAVPSGGFLWSACCRFSRQMLT